MSATSPMRATTLVFAEQFYYPEGWGGAQLPRDLTTYLAGNGARVEVICGSDQYAPMEADDCPDPRLAGVVIRRTPRLLPGSIHRYKLLKQLVFYAASLPLLFLRRAPDLFVTQTNPPLLVPLVATAAALRRRPLVVIAQDIYPEVMFAHGMSRENSSSGRLLSRLFRWSYRRATRVVALGPVMAQRLVRKGVARERITIVSNWATGMESVERGPGNTLREQWGLTGKFVMLYSGNIGIAHDVDTPLRALRSLLCSNPDVRMVFIGKGSRLAEAQHLARQLDVSHAVQFRPLVPAALLPQSLGLADIALVTLRQGFEGLVVPSKLLGYMARAIPTLYVGPDSDIEQMLLSAGGGQCVRNGDSDGLAHKVEQLANDPRQLRALGESAALYYESHLSRAQGLQKYSRLFDSLLAHRATVAGR